MDPVKRDLVSEEDYLDRERRSETKHEYLDGRVVAMAGGSPRHNLMAGNVIGALNRRLTGRCLVFPSDQRIYIVATGEYTYPDVSVVCGQVELHAKDRMSIVNPTLLVEVLSKSTENYDRGVKFLKHYQRIPSLQQYLMISQSEQRIEVFQRVDKRDWRYTEFTGDDVAAAIPALAVELPFAEVYAGVEQLPIE